MPCQKELRSAKFNDNKKTYLNCFFSLKIAKNTQMFVALEGICLIIHYFVHNTKLNM